jgi:hypothetical protein
MKNKTVTYSGYTTTYTFAGTGTVVVNERNLDKSDVRRTRDQVECDHCDQMIVKGDLNVALWESGIPTRETTSVYHVACAASRYADTFTVTAA